MFMRLVLLFTVVPVIELVLLIEIGRQIGSLTTIGIVVVTGFIGAMLAKTQGFNTWYQIRHEASEGRVPHDALLDGLLVLIGAVTLVTPGLITDAIGFSLLIPATRRIWRTWLKHRFDYWLQTGTLNIVRWK